MFLLQEQELRDINMFKIIVSWLGLAYDGEKPCMTVFYDGFMSPAHMRWVTLRMNDMHMYKLRGAINMSYDQVKQSVMLLGCNDLSFPPTREVYL